MTEPSPRRPLPPPLVPHPPGLWRTTPPAIFAPIMGLLGLGLLARAAGTALALAPLAQLAEAVLGAVVLLHGFAVLAYLGKIARRPGALLQDLGVLPGRAGVSAAVVGTYLSAAALVPYAPGLATAMVLLTLALHAALMLLVARILLTGPVEQRAVTPVMHLTFVGPIVAPFALIPLGWTGLAGVLIGLGLLVALPIWALGLRKAAATPAPLRPVLAIHLAPASVMTAGAALLGWDGLALGLGLWSVVLVVGLGLAAARGWLLAAGFSPFWGALTFPLAAFGQAALQGLGTPGLWLALAVLVLAAVVIPLIAWRILKDWPGGRLARKTSAAVA